MVGTVLFLLALAVANTVQAITGFAGNLLAMPVAIQVMGIEDARAVLNVVMTIITALVVVRNFKDINKKELVKITSLMFLGMMLGVYLIDIVAVDILLYIYGALIISIALKRLFIKKEIPLPSFIMMIVLFLAGVIQGMVVSGGSLLVIYAATALKDKNEFRATVSAVWVVLNLILMVTHVQSGYFTQNVFYLIALAIPVALFGVWAGGKLIKKINQEMFLRISYILLILSGLLLFF